MTPIVYFTIPESKTYLGLVALEVGEFWFFRWFLVNFLGFRDITYPRFSIFCSIKYFMLQIDLSCEISQNFILLVQTLRFCRSRIARGNSKSLLGYNFNKSRAFSICFQHTITWTTKIDLDLLLNILTERINEKHVLLLVSSNIR